MPEIPAETVVKANVPEQKVTLLPGLQVQIQEKDPSIPAQTTFQEDLTTSGQREINKMWETTQGKIAVNVVLGTMVVDGVVLILSIGLARDLTGSQALALGVINSLATGVMSFYFSRTNHAQIGGVGNKPSTPYVGR